jgi:hypothetical protein
MSSVEEGAMGEAKRKRQMLASIPDDVKADIAKIVRSVEVDRCLEGGTCVFRVITGKEVLRTLGIPCRIEFGGMLYRAGEDPTWDVLSYCGPRNTAYLDEDNFLGHAWLESGDDLIDFSVGDWRGQSVFDNAENGGRRLPPRLRTKLVPPQDVERGRRIIWTAPPRQDFFWQPAAGLKGPWKRDGEPTLGEAWYGPAATTGTAELINTAVARLSPALDPTLPHVAECIAQLRLKERLRYL